MVAQTDVDQMTITFVIKVMLEPTPPEGSFLVQRYNQALSPFVRHGKGHTIKAKGHGFGQSFPAPCAGIVVPRLVISRRCPLQTVQCPG